MLMEGFGFLDALYMTVITLATIGFREVQPLDAGGRILTIAIVGLGFAVVVYTVAVLSELFVSGEIGTLLRDRRRQRMIDRLSDHVIVVGFGRVGQAVVRELARLDLPCLVLDKDVACEAGALGAGVHFACGDATNEAFLLDSGLDRAAALVAAADADATNLVIVLTARALAPELRIVTRINDPDWTDRLSRAGADAALSPYEAFGQSLAASALRPGVIELHELPRLGLRSAEIEVLPGSRLAGRTIADIARHQAGVTFVGLRRDDRIHRYHELDGPVAPGDFLVAFGLAEELEELAKLSETTG